MLAKVPEKVLMFQFQFFFECHISYLLLYCVLHDLDVRLRFYIAFPLLRAHLPTGGAGAAKNGIAAPPGGLDFFRALKRMGKKLTPIL